MERKLMTDKQLKAFQAQYKRPTAIPVWFTRYTNLAGAVKSSVTLDRGEAEWAKDNNLYQVWDGVFISTAELETIQEAAKLLTTGEWFGNAKSLELANKLKQIAIK